jgi:hypothetical protein
VPAYHQHSHGDGQFLLGGQAFEQVAVLFRVEILGYAVHAPVGQYT